MGLKRAPRFLLHTLGYTLLLQVAFVASLLLRFEGAVPPSAWRGYQTVAPYFTVLSLVAYFAAGLYHGLWRYASTVTLFQILKGVTLSAMSLVIGLLFSPTMLYPRSLIVLVWLWELVLMGGARFAWRLSRERVLGPMPLRAGRALVVGAGNPGVHLITEMRRGPAGHEVLQPVGFIDDDPRLTDHSIEGVKVLGTIGDLPRVLQELRPEIVIVSDPDLPAKVVREIARVCAEAHVRVKTLPGLSDLQHGRTALSQMRDVSLEDLLGRQPVHLHLTEVAEFLRSQRVLVTGAGGSIGAELARQVASFDPARLVLLDHAENGLYYVHNELKALYPSLPIEPVVADIRDADAVEQVHARFRPTVVFHAAAHKHVPLLEQNPREAILNNVGGTRNLLDASERHQVGKFVLISTDKAVNPTSVMGATKRVCEMMMQSRSGRSHTRFAAVRFGNVLGSEGSVVPLFERQIQRGGPVTVTHPEARRFFMTIPEAVRLVLQAGSMGRGGEVFLLDMGEQVRISDLARQVIRMAGLEEGKDIEIVYTGLRPGEKLFEELHSDEERMRMTRHERILVWDLDAPPEAGLLEDVRELEARARSGDDEGIRLQLHRIVREYREPKHEALPLPAEDAELVELPAAALPPPAANGPRGLGWLRPTLDGALALVLLAMLSPAWGLVWLETRLAGQREPLLHLACVGRNRRWRQRRAARVQATIDRRSIERRTRDLLGVRISCARLRSDVGPVGRWLARRSLDRLPLLLNVLRGEMAMVGPRPESEDDVLRWHTLSPEFERRFSVLPGVTGLAQVSACSDQDPEGLACRIQYDLYYVDHRSLLLDVRTLARTLDVVLSGPGAGQGRSQPAGGRARRTHLRPGPPGRTAEVEGEAVAASATTAVKGVTR
jgi:FlaA1/EpsC-like NDP-sugar epimerase/lipopolysaccharide/colanic/teichoic acid biosynthesis glycosyltransferase